MLFRVRVSVPAMNGYASVDVRSSLRGMVGQLLDHFRMHLEEHFDVEIRHKGEGGHVTPWWLQLALYPGKLRASRLQFGETTCQAVNGIPHLWVKCSDKCLTIAKRFMQSFVTSMVQLRLGGK